MTAPRSLVVLGAGLGSRLHPLTADRPKCAVELAGEPLAARVIRQLHARGVGRATVVVGHMAERARELIGAAVGSLAGLELRFVLNADYATTNTMYSTLLAMDALEAGGLLVEGDIAASEVAIDRLVDAPAARSFWAADPWTPAHAGSRLRADGGGRIVGQEIVRAATVGDAAPARSTRRDDRPPAGSMPAPGLWKSAGMLALSRDGAAALARALRLESDAGQRNVYYDDVIGRHLADFDLRVLDLSGAPWVEIDDPNDMAEARRLFEAPERAR